MPTEPVLHRFVVEERRTVKGDVRFIPRCSCGWKGRRSKYATLLFDDWRRQHLDALGPESAG